MSGNSAEEDNLLSKCLEEGESPRKKTRLDNSGRKSWSLIDRRTDQEIQDDTADLHGVSQPVISKTCKKVAEILSRMSRRFIKMPATLHEQEESMGKFRSIANFPTVIGAIDCTHIRIKKINADGGQLYINRKGYYSINVQVLQEMGVSLLDPDEECEVSLPQPQHKPSLKRKRDQENVNPNVNSVMSPKGRSPMKSPLKSPLKVCSPVPGPSRVRSPRSSEKCKPLQPCDPHGLETTLITDYLIDEETPLNQVNTQYSGQSYLGTAASNISVTSSGGRRTCFTPLRLEEEQILRRHSEREPQGCDSFAVLSDEMLLSVFRWLPKRTLAHCMLVCKRWHRVACDETLWQRLDLGNKTLAKGALGRILARKPIIVRLASSEIGEWHPTTPVEPSRIQYLDLSVCTIDRLTLSRLLSLCPLLTKLSVEGVKIDASAVAKCKRLETLNLAMAQGIDAEGVDEILEGCPNLQSLNISWCRLSLQALEVLVNKLPPRLQRLNLSGARVLNDDMVVTLVSRCPALVELDLSDCPALGGPALAALSNLQRLEHLALSRCYLLPPHRLTKLSSITSLQYLEVWGMLQTASLSALKAALPTIQINQFMFSAIARPTVGTRRTSIWGLRTRD